MKNQDVPSNDVPQSNRADVVKHRILTNGQRNSVVAADAIGADEEHTHQQNGEAASRNNSTVAGMAKSLPQKNTTEDKKSEETIEDSDDGVASRVSVGVGSSQESGVASEQERQSAEEMSYIARFVKDCPRCFSLCEKVWGCDHVTCPRCGHHFCWRCRADWSKSGQA